MRPAIVLRLFAIMGLLMLVALVPVIKAINVERYRPQIIAFSKNLLGRPIEIRGRLALRLSFQPRIEAYDLVIPETVDPDGGAPVLTIAHLDADIALLPLLAGKIHLRNLTAVGIHLAEPIDPHHRPDWLGGLVASDDSGAAEAGGPDPSMPPLTVGLDQVVLQDVTWRFHDPRSGEEQSANIRQATADIDPPTGRIAFRLTGRIADRAVEASGMIGSLRDWEGPKHLLPVTMKLILPGLVSTLDGQVTLAADGTADLHMEVIADAADTVAVGRLLGIPLPPMGAARARFVLTGPMFDHLRADEVDLAFGRKDALAIGLRGSVADPVGGRGVDIAMTVDGDSLPNFGKIFDLPLPSLGAVHWTARLRDQDGGWQISDISGGGLHNDVAGQLTILPKDGRWHLDGQLQSTRLDMGKWFLAPVDSNKPAIADGLLVSDRPWSLPKLDNLDGQLRWTIDAINGWGLQAKQVQIPVTLQDNQLMAQLDIGAIAGGHASLSIQWDDRGETPILSGTLSTEGVQVGPLITAIAGANLLSGAATDLHASFSGGGASPHALLTHLRGDGTIAVGAGMIGWSGGPVDGAAWLTGDEIPLRCAYGHVMVKDGLAVSESILFDVASLTIGGRGSVNLSREEIDLLLVPRPRDPQKSANFVPLDVGGSLRHPSILPARGASVKAMVPPVSAVASGGAGNPCEAVALAKPAAAGHDVSHISPSSHYGASP